MIGVLPRTDQREGTTGAQHEAGGLMQGVRWIRHNAIVRASLLGVATLEPVQLHVLRSVPALRNTRIPCTPGDARDRDRHGIDRHRGGFLRNRSGRAENRCRPHLHRRLFPVPRPTDPRPRCGRPPLARPRTVVCCRVLLRHRLDASRHHGRNRSPPRPSQRNSARASRAPSCLSTTCGPLGTTLGGILGTIIGVRPTLWIASIEALIGLAWLLPSPIRNTKDIPAEASI